ncbi:hypothetical protein H5410_055008 [Solanum commersonii]|uniref:Uncharacterized protein n=1 Tax=Solanum commersonii TaxID=4109 RepID=A0A9J5WGZ0_SOLCO|nr:hypothetical protein H5410_055008 [Solanum commersonii]
MLSSGELNHDGSPENDKVIVILLTVVPFHDTHRNINCSKVLMGYVAGAIWNITCNFFKFFSFNKTLSTSQQLVHSLYL